jgi:hypothetical protein
MQEDRIVPSHTAVLTRLAFGLVFWAPVVLAQSRNLLTNEDVMRMARLKFDETTIIKTIQLSDANFDLTVAALVKLKDEGVGQAVIQAMLAVGSAKKEGRIGPVTSAGGRTTSERPVILPDEVGVFLRQKDKLVSIEPEIANWRTGGVIKHAVTLGLDRGHINGTVNRPHSRLDLTWAGGMTSSFMGVAVPLEFYIRCAEGDSASEYQLLHFWEKSNRREFRTVTGGILHESGGAQNNVVDFTFDKVASRTYKIDLANLSVGEYGFLAPGTTASLNAASQGKVYTFRIVE